MLSGNLNSFRKRSVGLDLNQAFTEEDEEEEKEEGKVKEDESQEEEEEEEEDKEKEQNRIRKELNDREEEEGGGGGGGVLSMKEQGGETGEPHQVGFLAERCLVSDLKLCGNQGECNVLFGNECMLKDGLELSLEGTKQNYEGIESPSSHGPPEYSNKFLHEGGITNDLELCEKQGDFLPKGRLIDGLKLRENHQGESRVIPEKECSFRDGLNLNLDESNYHGTLEGLVVETKGSSPSPVPPPDRERYLSTVTHDAFQVRGHRSPSHQRSPEKMVSNHYTLNQRHSPIRDSFSGRHIEHDLLRSPREPSSRMHIERDISRSPRDAFSRGQIEHRDSFSRKHIELELPRSPKGYFSRRFIERDLLKSPRARLMERDHSRSPRDFSHNRRYRELSPPSVSPQTRTRHIRGSCSRTPPRGYRHSPRPRYSPQGRYSPRRQSPQNHRSRKRPWSPPPNRNTGIGKPGRNLFIAGFSFNTTERDLERKFSRYGHVRDVRIVRDKRSGDSRGFGFLSLGHDEDADAAIRGLDKTEWNGRIILVEKAKRLKFPTHFSLYKI